MLKIVRLEFVREKNAPLKLPPSCLGIAKECDVPTKLRIQEMKTPAQKHLMAGWFER